MTYDRKHKMAEHLSSVHCMLSSATHEFKTEDYYSMEVVSFRDYVKLSSDGG